MAVSARTSRCLLAAILLMLAFFTMLPCTGNGFLHWDDPQYAVPDSLLHGMNAGGVFFSIFSRVRHGVYTPVTFLSHAVVYSLLGPSAEAAHTANIILHALNAFLVFWFILSLSGRQWPAFFAAALFAVHPMNVEPVAWATERMMLLCAFFYLGSLIVYLRYLRSGSRTEAAAAFVLFLAALLSKPVALTLPVVLIGLDVALGSPVTLRSVVRKWPYFAFSVQIAVITVLVSDQRGFIEQAVSARWLNGVASSLQAILFYFHKLAWPSKFSLVYPDLGTFGLWTFLAVLLLIVAVWVLGKKNPKIFLGIGFFLVTALPMLPWLEVRPSVVADRYMYLPSIGFFYALTGLLGRYDLGRFARLAAGLLVAALIVGLAVMSFYRCKLWGEDVTLWNDAIFQYPGKLPAAYANLGTEYLSRGQTDKAITFYDQALGASPQFPHALHNRGNAYLEKGRMKEAMQDLDAAIRVKPDYAEAYASRAQVETVCGRYTDALLDIDSALALQPDLPMAKEFRSRILSAVKATDNKGGPR